MAGKTIKNVLLTVLPAAAAPAGAGTATAVTVEPLGMGKAAGVLDGLLLRTSGPARVCRRPGSRC